MNSLSRFVLKTSATSKSFKNVFPMYCFKSIISFVKQTKQLLYAYDLCAADMFSSNIKT